MVCFCVCMRGFQHANECLSELSACAAMCPGMLTGMRMRFWQATSFWLKFVPVKRLISRLC